MKQVCRILLLLLLFPLPGLANNLASHLDELKKQVGEVESEKKTYQQEISFDPAAPYRIEVLCREVDKKGKITETKAVLNLGLLDNNLVRRENARDLMWVSARSGGMAVIKMYKDGVLDNYASTLTLYSKNVDNARAIEEALKAAIPLAKEAWEKSVSLLADLAGLRDWLARHIKQVEAGDTKFKQAIEPDKQHPTQLWLAVEEYDKKGLKKTERFGIDPGDLHEPSVSMRINKNLVKVEANVRQNQSFVSVEENGELAGLTKSVTFYVDDVDQAQLLVQVLQNIIPLAREASEKLLPNPTSLQNGLQLLQQQIKGFAAKQVTYEQSLTDAQLATYALRTSTDKGTTEEQFKFDFADLTEKAVTIVPARHLYVVEVPTQGKQAYVEVRKNGELQNYAQKLEFYAPDLATAKQLQHVLSYVISASSKEVAPKNIDWLRTTLSGFDERQLEIKQMLDVREGEQCKVAFTTRKESSKKVDEHLYEFNLYDIDPSKMYLNVRGKTVTVGLPTNYSEAIIKDYENGGKINYKKEVALVVPSIETGKAIMATFQQMAKQCAKK